jgi:hypothetical protein
LRIGKSAKFGGHAVNVVQEARAAQVGRKNVVDSLLFNRSHMSAVNSSCPAYLSQCLVDTTSAMQTPQGIDMLRKVNVASLI